MQGIKWNEPTAPFKRSENPTLQQKRGPETYPTSIHTRYKFDWANTFFKKKERNEANAICRPPLRGRAYIINERALNKGHPRPDITSLYKVISIVLCYAKISIGTTNWGQEVPLIEWPYEPSTQPGENDTAVLETAWRGVHSPAKFVLKGKIKVLFKITFLHIHENSTPSET